MPPPGQTGRRRHHVFYLSVCPIVRLSVTELVNTMFWKKMNWCWWKLAEVVTVSRARNDQFWGSDVKGQGHKIPLGEISRALLYEFYSNLAGKYHGKCPECHSNSDAKCKRSSRKAKDRFVGLAEALFSTALAQVISQVQNILDNFCDNCFSMACGKIIEVGGERWYKMIFWRKNIWYITADECFRWFLSAGVNCKHKRCTVFLWHAVLCIVTHKFSVSVRSRCQNVLVDEGQIRVIQNGVVCTDVDKQRCKWNTDIKLWLQL